MKLGMRVGLGPGHIVLHGDPVPLPKSGTAPNFRLISAAAKWLAAWIKMSLGMELGLGQGDFVLDGDHAPLPIRGRSPHPKFSAHVYCGQAAG